MFGRIRVYLPGNMAGDIECPVCMLVIPAIEIQEHVDQCLKSSTTESQTISNYELNATSTRNRSLKQTILPLPSLTKRKRSPEVVTVETSPDTKQQKLFNILSSDTINNPITSTAASNCASPAFSVEHCHVLNNTLTVPLADVVRPNMINDFMGQERVVGKDSILKGVIETGEVPSMILWGPPGCGKTTLARIIANSAKQKQRMRFVQLSATTSGVSDVKETIKVAKNEKKLLKRETLLFIDEIHRFNKLQQDTFLPHVENGTIVLIGATTENPSFQLNAALLSRCFVIVMQKLTVEDVEAILRRALDITGVNETEMCEDRKTKFSNSELYIHSEAITTLAQFCDGDARVALNGLQLAIQSLTVAEKGQEYKGNCPTENIESKRSNESGSVTDKMLANTITIEDVKKSLQCTHLLYDKAGDEHYNCISALIKSMRGSDANAALYWLARMLTAGEDPLYIARRVVIFASEDIGLADCNALCQAVAAFQACHVIGMPECELNLSQAVIYMARAAKSRDVCNAYQNAKACIKNHHGPMPSVPLHLCNAPTKLMKNLGYGKGYDHTDTSLCYLPPELKGIDFF